MGKKVSIRGNLLGEIERIKLFRDRNEVIEVIFILFEKNISEYLRCLFYGDENLNYREGDLIYVFGSYVNKNDFIRILMSI